MTKRDRSGSEQMATLAPTAAAHSWLAAIIDLADDAIVSKDLNDIVTSWNKAAEALFGYPSDEIIGLPITHIIPSDRRIEETLIADRIYRGEKIVHLVTTRLRKDGSVIPVSLTISPIRDEQRTIIGVSTFARSVEQPQRNAGDLQGREILLCSILDTVPDALVTTDDTGLIHSFSAAAERLFGYSAQEVVGQNTKMLRSFADHGERDGYLQRYISTGMQSLTGIGRRKDGSTFPMATIFAKVDLPGPRLFTEFLRNLTEPVNRESDLRSARDVAEQENQAKSQFLATMSHQMRSLISGILGYAELLHMEGGLNAQQSARADAMLGAGKHLLEMITCVLDLSEIQAEGIELQAVKVDVQAVAAACLDLVRPAAEAKNLMLGIAVTSGMRQNLTTDPRRLRQVLLNLLGNAVKYTDKGGVEIRLLTVKDDSALRIEIADTGPGIPDNQRHRLFQDFERFGTPATSGFEGAGLGLSLSFRLVVLMGGCLGYAENPGGGSVFWLELPLDTAPLLPATEPVFTEPVSIVPEAQPEPLPARVLRILVVDDIFMNREIASSFLRAAGHDVTCVDGGAEAVAVVSKIDFDVVLMDVRMPEMDGLEATRRIRALGGACGRVPVVALTAQAFAEQVAECRKAGMDDHVSKPFDQHTLVAAVMRAVGAKLPAGESLDLVVVPEASAVPDIDEELRVINLVVYNRTVGDLAPEVVSAYFRTIVELGQTLVRGLHKMKAHIISGKELADEVHTLAGCADSFGFERLAVLGRRFERAAQSGAEDLLVLADTLSTATEATLQEIYNRRPA